MSPTSLGKKKAYDPMKRKRKEQLLVKEMEDKNAELVLQLAAATQSKRDKDKQLSEERAIARSELERHSHACKEFEQKLADQEADWEAKLAAELSKKQKVCDEQLREREVMHSVRSTEAVASVKLETTQLYKTLHVAELERIKSGHEEVCSSHKSLNDMLTAEQVRLKQHIAQLEEHQRNMIDHTSQLESEKKRLMEQNKRLRAHYHYKNAYKQLLKYTTIKSFVKDKKITKYLYSLVYHLCEEVERFMEIPDIRHALLGMPEFEIWYASYQKGFPIEHLKGQPTADKQNSYQLLQLLVDLASMYDMMITQVLDLHIHYKNASHSMFERVLSLTNHSIKLDKNLKKTENKCEELREKYEKVDGRLRLDQLHQRKAQHNHAHLAADEEEPYYPPSRPKSRVGMPRVTHEQSQGGAGGRPKTSPVDTEAHYNHENNQGNAAALDSPTNSYSPSSLTTSAPPIADAEAQFDSDERIIGSEHFPSRPPSGAQSARGPRPKKGFVPIATQKRRQNARLRKRHKKDALRAKLTADAVYSRKLPRPQKYQTHGNRILGRPTFSSGVAKPGSLYGNTKDGSVLPFGHVAHWNSRMINSHFFSKMSKSSK